MPILDEDMGCETSSSSDVERVANQAASDFCVPQDKMNSFFARKSPYFSERDTLAFASRTGVHPGLVVGQIQRRSGRYDFLRRHQVKVREHLMSSALVDGWGEVIHVDL